MAFRTTGIACFALGLRAVLGNVTRSGAVVALGALYAFTRNVTYASAGVAGLLVTASKGAIARATAISTAASTTATTTTASTSSTSSRISAGGAVARNMAYLSAAVTFGIAVIATAAAGITTATTASTAISSGFSAVTGNMAFLPALVARLWLGIAGAIARDVTLLSTVIASGRTRLRAGSSLMTD